MEKVVVLGCGGHAKSIIDMIEQQESYEVAGFITNEESEGFMYRGYPVLGTDALLPMIFQSGIKSAVIAVGYLGNSKVRDHIYEMLKFIGFKLPVIIDKTAIIARDVIIGEGTVIGKAAIINSNAILGTMAIVNTGALIEHDCEVGDFAHIAVGCVLCGNVKVENHAFVGAGTNIIHGITVGENSVIGAGSTVIGSVRPNTCVYGIVK
ncbi:acetyltransferase [Lachnoclostridium sp.]|uniref:acetyltransferase n=1 Tax=Lachnoclostridium sp. TaxID=2028282 RepID=UPI0028A2D5CE|nr:acetyltransferase [Lachnoclostridium sp.]